MSVWLDLPAVLVLLVDIVSGLLAVAELDLVGVVLVGAGALERFAVTALTGLLTGFAPGRLVGAAVGRFAVVRLDRLDVVELRRLVGAGVGRRAEVLLGLLADVVLARRVDVELGRLALVVVARFGAALCLLFALAGVDRPGLLAIVTFLFFVSTIYCYLDG